VSDKCAFIAAEYAERAGEPGNAPTLSQMLGWLNVSKSGFYEWRDREPSATAIRREQLNEIVTEVFEEFGGTYGYRRIHAELLRRGVTVGDELVRDLMRELGLVTVQPRPYRTTTVPGEQEYDVPDLVRRDFTADRPGMKLVGDMTYISTWQGWLYLATVIDCFNKEVVGYALADHMRTELVTGAVRMAARNYELEPDCIMHSDRGSQYTSAEYRACLDELGLRHSVGRTGVCWDNAAVESFWATLKKEFIHLHPFDTVARLRRETFEYIEGYYNTKRLHSSLGYMTPSEYEEEFFETRRVHVV